jgi:superoxide dismutase, Cu-Zn family
MRNNVARVLAVVALASLIGAALTSGGASAAPRGLVAPLKDAAGASIGTVRFVPTDDGKVSVRIAVSGLTPGFHGFHVHTTGTCDPAAVDTTGAPVAFFSAGGHFNPGAGTHSMHAGDMSPLLVNADGTGKLRFSTDRFVTRDLMDEDGSAVIVHAGPDNLANIPATTSAGADRYHSHVDDVLGADTATKATGDAGARFACGVVQKPTN